MAILGSTTLTGCDSIPSFIAGGTVMLFEQTSAPTSWTKKTTHNNKALRVVNGTVAPGGSITFTSAFASRTPSGTVSVSVSGGTVGSTTLTTPQIPSHTHQAGSIGYVPGVSSTDAPGRSPMRRGNTSSPASGERGGDGSHSHPFSVGSASGSFSGTAQNFAVQYVDIILATKN